MCAPVFAHSRCTRIRIEKPLSVYYSYVSTVGKSGYIKKKRSSNYFREIIIQSRNFSTIRVYTRIRYIRVERSTPVPIRLNARFDKKKKKRKKHGHRGRFLPSSRGNIWTHDLSTYLPIAFTDSFRYFFAYRPPLVAINAAVAMAIERTRKISLPDSRF